MITEKNIYQNWKQRFSYPSSGYEKQGSKFAQKIKNLRQVSFTKVSISTENRPLVMMASDGLNVDQTKQMIEILNAEKKQRRVFVTTRFLARHQRRIDRYLQKKITLHTLLAEISHNWLEKRNFEILFLHLQKNKILVRALGLNTLSKEDDRIVREIKNAPMDGFQTVIWIGPLRSSCEKIRKAAIDKNAAWIWFQHNEIRWKFAKLKKWQQIGSKNEFVNLGSSSLVSLDEYFASMENEDQIIASSDFIKITNDLAKKLARILGQLRVETIQDILHPFNQASINQMNRLSKDRKIFRFIVDRVMSGESAVIPSKKWILLSTQRLSHIAEEVAHFLRTAQRPNEKYGQASAILEEALAFFASLLVNKNRQIPKMAKKTNDWDHVHHVGYQIGFQLHRTWNQSKKVRTNIQKVWNTYPKNELEAELLIQKLLSL